MHKIFILFVLASTPLLASQCYPDRPKCPPIPPCRPECFPGNPYGVTLEVDYWGVLRKNVKKLNMVTPNQPGLHTIHFGYQSGVRGRAELLWGWLSSVEFRFAGLLEWHKSRNVTNSAGMSLSTAPFATNDWVNFQTIIYKYRSTFDSYELSYFRHFTPRQVDYFSFAMNLGLRVIDFQDKIFLTQEIDDFTVRCKNLPVGGQVGFDFEANPPPGNFTFKVDARVGMYGNMIKKSIILFDNGNTTLAADTLMKKTELAFTTDIIPSLIYRRGLFYVTAGFEYFGLYNVAFAPMQINVNKLLTHTFARRNLFLECFYVGGGLAF